MNGGCDNFRITVRVPPLRVLEVLANAYDSGACAYWIVRDSFSCELPEGFTVDAVPWLDDEQREIWRDFEGDLAALVPGGRVVFDEKHGDDEPTSHVLDLSSIERGLSIMAEKAPRHFADLLSGNDDAETADVFVQLCTLGEVRYG
jgi:hypothetical protein